MKYIMLSIIILLTSCTGKKSYDTTDYYDLKEQDELLTQIATYLMDAPVGAKMTNRFDDKYASHYSLQASKFSLVKYFITDDGTHYFYIVRPASKIGEHRGVGGHFKMKDKFQLSDFREEFVTPVMSIEDIKGKSAFLFDEMVKGNLEKYLEMESYVQWPNPITYYDTLTYEWKLKPDFEREGVEKDSIVTDSISFK